MGGSDEKPEVLRRGLLQLGEWTVKNIVPTLLVVLAALLIGACGSGDSADMKHCMKTAQSHNNLTDQQARDYCEALGVS